MRERVEDLGRIAVMIGNVLDHQVLEGGDGKYRPSRPKDGLDWFEDKSAEEKEDILRAWMYGLEEIQNQLHEIGAIAQGTHLLNTMKEWI